MYTKAVSVGGGIRIIGGEPVENLKEEAPFVVTYQIMKNIPEYCTGVLLNKRLVITAARCFHHFTEVNFEV